MSLLWCPCAQHISWGVPVDVWSVWDKAVVVRCSIKIQPILHYIVLHYTTLHCTILHYTRVHCAHIHMYLVIYLTIVEYRNACTRISAMLTTYKANLPDLKTNSNSLLPSKTLYLPPEVPHGSNKWVLDIPTTNSACEVIHVHSPDHRSSISVVLNPVHFVPDRSLIIKPHPLVPLHCIWHLHLIVPDIRSTIPQHFTHLWHGQFEQTHNFERH